MDGIIFVNATSHLVSRLWLMLTLLGGQFLLSAMNEPGLRATDFLSLSLTTDLRLSALIDHPHITCNDIYAFGLPNRDLAIVQED